MCRESFLAGVICLKPTPKLQFTQSDTIIAANQRIPVWLEEVLPEQMTPQFFPAVGSAQIKPIVFFQFQSIFLFRGQSQIQNRNWKSFRFFFAVGRKDFMVESKFYCWRFSVLVPLLLRPPPTFFPKLSNVSSLLSLNTLQCYIYFFNLWQPLRFLDLTHRLLFA